MSDRTNVTGHGSAPLMFNDHWVPLVRPCDDPHAIFEKNRKLRPTTIQTPLAPGPVPALDASKADVMTAQGIPLQATIRGTDKSHKLDQRGATPRPATISAHTIDLLCPRCAARESVTRMKRDPKAAAILNIACLKCDPNGKNTSFRYLDLDGKEVRP